MRALTRRRIVVPVVATVAALIVYAAPHTGHDRAILGKAIHPQAILGKAGAPSILGKA